MSEEKPTRADINKAIAEYAIETVAYVAADDAGSHYSKAKVDAAFAKLQEMFDKLEIK